VYCAVRRIRCFTTYGEIGSPINLTPRDPTDTPTYEAHCTALGAVQGLDDSQLVQDLDKVNSVVDALYASDQVDTVFKGKWYATFLTHDAGIGRDKSKCERYTTRLYGALQDSLVFIESWAGHFRDRIDAVVASVFP